MPPVFTKDGGGGSSKKLGSVLEVRVSHHRRSTGSRAGKLSREGLQVEIQDGMRFHDREVQVRDMALTGGCRARIETRVGRFKGSLFLFSFDSHGLQLRPVYPSGPSVQRTGRYQRVEIVRRQPTSPLPAVVGSGHTLIESRRR